MPKFTITNPENNKIQTELGDNYRKHGKVAPRKEVKSDSSALEGNYTPIKEHPKFNTQQFVGLNTQQNPAPSNNEVAQEKQLQLAAEKKLEASLSNTSANTPRPM